MDRFERLIDLGLNVEEATLITTPVDGLTIEEVKAGFRVLDKRTGFIYGMNKDFVSSYIGSMQVIDRDNFEPFQNPCNTDVIITSERQRKDEMKRHECIDARELIPHGKTSLLDV